MPKRRPEILKENRGTIDNENMVKATTAVAEQPKEEIKKPEPIEVKTDLERFREKQPDKPWREIPNWFVWNPGHLCARFAVNLWPAIHKDLKAAEESITDADWQIAVDEVMGRTQLKKKGGR